MTPVKFPRPSPTLATRKPPLRENVKITQRRQVDNAANCLNGQAPGLTPGTHYSRGIKTAKPFCPLMLMGSAAFFPRMPSAVKRFAGKDAEKAAHFFCQDGFLRSTSIRQPTTNLSRESLFHGTHGGVMSTPGQWLRAFRVYPGATRRAHRRNSANGRCRTGLWYQDVPPSTVVL